MMDDDPPQMEMIILFFSLNKIKLCGILWSVHVKLVGGEKQTYQHYHLIKVMVVAQ